MNKTRLLLCGCIGLFLTACDRTPSGQTAVLGDYTVIFSHQPDPFKVGFDADIQLRIHDQQGRAQPACTAGFRQSMPDMEMSNDQLLVPMSYDDDGVYHGKAAIFSMGGEWLLGIEIDCGDGPLKHSFRYQLEWPE